jgi:hypothetical protein
MQMATGLRWCRCGTRVRPGPSNATQPLAPAEVNDMSDSHDRADAARNSTADATPEPPLRAEGSPDGWTAATWSEGLQIDRLGVLEPLTVRTRNSTYTIVVLRPATGEVLVRGGRICPTFERGVLVGATGGGGVIKLRGIYPGLRMEIIIPGRRVLTSVVESVAPDPRASTQGAF